MIKSCRPFFPYLNRMISQSLVVGTLTTIGLLSGLTPGLSRQSALPIFSSAAYAQSASNEELTRFARAAFAIELKRRTLEQEIKSITGGSVPEIGCNQPDKLASLPNNIRGIAENFCQFSRETLQNNRLPVSRFNAIKTNYENDPAFRTRVDNELLRIQQNSAGQ